MIEMFEVNNNYNATMASAVNLNLNQSNHDNNLLTADSQLLTLSAFNSTMLTQSVVNTTAIAMDYATQWLSTTIATAAVNLSNMNNETPSSSFTTLASDIILNYTTTATALNNPTTINNGTYDFSHNAGTTLPSLMDNEDDDNDYDDCHPENPNFNCSRMDYLEFILGPQTLPLFKVLMITIIYGGIFFTGFIGNIFVCVVIFKHPTMHTATNYYLFSLAVSDLIYLIFGLPTEVILYWHQYPYLFSQSFCKARAYISEASTYVSVLTIVAFSVERYLAICHPLYLYAMSGFRRALSIIVFLWLVSFALAVPFFIYTDIIYWNYPPDNSQIDDSAMCTFNTPGNFPLFEVSSLLSFFVPMFSMFYFYGRMGIKICSRTTQQLGVQKGSLQRKTKHQQSRKAVIRMLAAVVVTFFICWLPFHIQRLWYVHGKENQNYQEINEWLFSMTGFAYYVTCTINPILYNVMSHRYRVAFKDILCCKRRNLYYNNGFSRDQSRFTENSNASSLCHSTYNRVNSVRVHSFRIVNNTKDRSSFKSNNVLWRKSDYNTTIEEDIRQNHSTSLNSTNDMVVCVDNGVNGHAKVFTQNEVHETLLNRNNGTRI